MCLLMCCYLSSWSRPKPVHVLNINESHWSPLASRSRSDQIFSFGLGIVSLNLNFMDSFCTCFNEPHQQTTRPECALSSLLCLSLILSNSSALPLNKGQQPFPAVLKNKTKNANIVAYHSRKISSWDQTRKWLYSFIWKNCICICITLIIFIFSQLSTRWTVCQ